MLSDKVYRELLGLPLALPSTEVSSFLKDMMLKSIGNSMANLEVEVLGTVETQALSLQVSIKALEQVTT